MEGMIPTARLFVGLGAASAGIGVAAGAFGAHGLSSRLEPRMLEVFEVGVRYQMYHALALLAVGLVLGRSASGALTFAGYSFLVGTLLFSGSLYALSLSGISKLGAITPIGGLAFLAGWAAFAFAMLRPADL